MSRWDGGPWVGAGREEGRGLFGWGVALLRNGFYIVFLVAN